MNGLGSTWRSSGVQGGSLGAVPVSLRWFFFGAASAYVRRHISIHPNLQHWVADPGAPRSPPDTSRCTKNKDPAWTHWVLACLLCMKTSKCLFCGGRTVHLPCFSLVVFVGLLVDPPTETTRKRDFQVQRMDSPCREDLCLLNSLVYLSCPVEDTAARAAVWSWTGVMSMLHCFMVYSPIISNNKVPKASGG